MKGKENKEITATDFTNRIILVHPLQPNSILDLLFKIGKDHLIAFNSETDSFDVSKTIQNAITQDDTLLTNDAIIGSHLAFSAHQYTHSFVDRPHVHWWWNGLFQANSGGDWEHSLVAFFEPLSAVDNVMGCAPYDTMTMGPHQFTKESCILVPDESVEPLRARLQSYPGKIIGFDPSKETLRSAINRVLEVHYPKAFIMTDKKGHNINELALSGGDNNFNPSQVRERNYNSVKGYFEDVFIRSEEGADLIPLMQGEKTLLMPAYQTYAQGRFVGLHSHSPTDIESDRLMKILRTVSVSPNKLPQFKPNFVGQEGVRNLNELVLVRTFTICQKLMEYSSETGLHSYAQYLLKKSFLADFRSVHQGQDGQMNMPVSEVQSLIDNHYKQLLRRVETLANALELPNDAECNHYKQQMVDEYRLFLENLPNSVHRFSNATTQTFYSKPEADSAPPQEIQNARVEMK
ncbi:MULTISPECIES: hypothetical protein [Legionella]|uniref:Uncharacterized protein n=1 Tax=Legionella maceachernii TaxID=466 RepID=A0A0W0WGK9_9GAMM|nr:hypothetical protein [Legionella maceachernii]KTD31492.1 hypothetical protein Lmac_0240 [Legionella maceachernii]SJZ94785.1 hypothetical protein SAMN02745128_01549 [Legionella maceachernii]SUP03347.1 Uncharacterised protein [Legionella maceachernii]